MMPLEKNMALTNDQKNTFGQYFDHVFDAVVVFKGDLSINFLAQDEASCVVFGMPREAIKLGAAAKVLPLSHMAAIY